MKIGGLKVPGTLLLAPMADVTNPAFRCLCKRYGAAITYSEMISADALLNYNEKTMYRAVRFAGESPFGIQLFGNSPETLTRAAVIIEEEYVPELIDINLGCPSPIITNAGCGAALLRDPDLISDILTQLCDTLNTPVTAKIRILPGLEETLELAGMIQDCGVSALTVHGRTLTRGYRGLADHGYAKMIKEELSIPVIANGDVRDGPSAAAVLEKTGCDGVMVGRASVGDPHVFERISHYLETGEILEASCSRRRQDCLDYLDLLEEYDCISHLNLRAHVQWFTKGLKGSRQMRKRIGTSDSIPAFVECIMSMCDTGTE